MDDLIPRAAAIEAFDDERVDRNYGDVSPESVIGVIESIPAVDAAPVVHGRWKIALTDKNEFWANYCSVCNTYLPYGIEWKPNYCPNCGAKMDGEADEQR